MDQWFDPENVADDMTSSDHLSLGLHSLSFWMSPIESRARQLKKLRHLFDLELLQITGLSAQELQSLKLRELSISTCNGSFLTQLRLCYLTLVGNDIRLLVLSRSMEDGLE